MKFQQLLQEMNIFDVQPIENSLNEILKAKEANATVKRWFKTKYISWLKSADRDDQKLRFFNKHRKSEGDPEWASNTFDFREFSQDEINKIHHIVDYFNTLSDVELKKIGKQTVFDIEQKVTEWEATYDYDPEDVLRGKAKGDVNSVLTKHRKGDFTVDLVQGKDYKIIEKVLLNSVPYLWVRHLSKESCKAEGDDMGHCVGSYNPKVDPIFSLWDRNGNARITMQLSKNLKKALQIKGKQDKVPHPKYIPLLKDFITSRGIEVVNDGEALGMDKWKGKFYFPDSEEFKLIESNEILPAQVNAFIDVIRNCEPVSAQAELWDDLASEEPWATTIKEHGITFDSGK